MSVDENTKLAHYSLAYINYRLCSIDNGRVLGYDNSHGYHHRHFMGKEEPIEFKTLRFEDPTEMLRFLSETKIKLIDSAQNTFHYFPKIGLVINSMLVHDYPELRQSLISEH